MTGVVGRAYEQDQHHPAPGDTFGRLNPDLLPLMQHTAAQWLNPRVFQDAAAVERYHLLAQWLGVSREEADRLLADAREDGRTWEWAFSPISDAERRLRELYVNQWPEPSHEERQAARECLAWLGGPYTPEGVDNLARSFARLQQVRVATAPEQRAQRLRLRRIHSAYSRHRRSRKGRQ